MADPAPVVQTFFVDQDISAKYRLDSVITVVDTKYILTRLKEVKPEGVENESVEQVAFADRILLNKTDLAKDEAELVTIEKELKKINPSATILRTQQSSISPKELLNIQAFELNRVLEFDPEFLSDDQEHQHDETVTSLGCKVKGQVNVNLLERWIQRLIQDDGANLYRYKGVLAVKGMEEKFVFQGVGMMFSGGFKDFKWKVPEEERDNRFIFIGKNLDKEFLRAGFMACLVEHELRFKVGDIVQANVGTFIQGRIVKQWDEGNAYRVELNDGRNTNVWAPVDIDVYIRKPK